MAYKKQSYNSAFTIVELLVVIVIIGILAAITSVSYANISQRAISTFLIADLTSASTLLKLDSVANDAYPTTLALANGGRGINASPDTTYKYAVSNITNPKTFCLTATKNNQSYNITQDGQYMPAPCPILRLDAGNTSSYPKSGLTWTDLSGNGNNGSLTNGVLYDSSAGGSMIFDGIDDRAILSTSQLRGSEGVTMSIWYKTTISKSYNYLMAKGNLSSGNPLSKMLGMELANNRFSFQISQGDGTGWCSQRNDGPVIPIDGTWHFLSGTFSISAQTINDYVDGGLAFTMGCDQIGDSEGSNILYIGQDSTLVGFGVFSGSLNDARVYDRVLSSAEIKQIFDSTRSRYGL